MCYIFYVTTFCKVVICVYFSVTCDQCSELKSQTLSCTGSCSSSDIDAVDIDVDESCPCGQDGVLLQEHSGSTFISQNGCESDESSELDDDAADCNCGPFGGRAAYF